MKDYFKDIDFGEIEDTEEQTKSEDRIKVTKKAWNEVKTEIVRMVNGIERGDSNISRPIQFVGTPFKDVMGRMLECPTVETIKEFLKISQSDINRRFRKECEKILFTKVTNLEEILGEKNEQDK